MRSLNKTPLFLLAGIVWLALGLVGCREESGASKSGDFAIDEVFERGPLTVHVRVDPNQLSIAELLTLQLEATVDNGYAVRMPAIDQVLQHFGIVDWHNPGDRLGQDNQRIKSLTYELEPFLSGDYELPAFLFEFYDVNDPNKVHQLETEPIPVTVTSLLGEDRANLTIADIETVVEIPRPPLPWWFWVLLLGGLLMAAAGVTIYVLRRKQVAALVRIFKPAHEVAYARLQALVNQSLIEKGEIKRFYEEISHILRHYLEDRFRLHAPERTTEEFLQELAQDERWSGQQRDSLGAFLQHCDLVKFATYEPGTEEIQQTFDHVKTLIENTRSDQHQIDVTDTVTVPEKQSEEQEVSA